MKTIQKEVINEMIINKSKFITIIQNINDIDKVPILIKKYKKIYKNATHYCYAYIIGSYQKCSDDGEPTKTAGLPILTVLKNNDLTNTICIVIRYYGGIKLGTNGLVKAYSKSTVEAINKSQLTNLIDGFYLKITFDYKNLKNINYLLKDININKEFNDQIIYSFDIDYQTFQKIENNLKKYAKIIYKEARQIIV